MQYYMYLFYIFVKLFFRTIIFNTNILMAISNYSFEFWKGKYFKMFKKIMHLIFYNLNWFSFEKQNFASPQDTRLTERKTYLRNIKQKKWKWACLVNHSVQFTRIILLYYVFGVPCEFAHKQRTLHYNDLYPSHRCSADIAFRCNDVRDWRNIFKTIAQHTAVMVFKRVRCVWGTISL